MTNFVYHNIYDGQNLLFLYKLAYLMAYKTQFHPTKMAKKYPLDFIGEGELSCWLMISL